MGEWLVHIVMLGICALQDMREKKVSLWKIGVYAGLILTLEIWKVTGKSSENWLLQIALAALGAGPGMALLLLGRLSEEAVGYGDGMLAVILGISFGFWKTMGLLMLAFSGVFLTAFFLYRTRGAKKGQEIAFVPFLFLGTAGIGLGSMGGIW